MADVVAEGSQFDARQFDTKKNERFSTDGKGLFIPFSFDDMGMKESILRAIYAHGFEKPEKPSAIQQIQQRGIVAYAKSLNVIKRAQPGIGFVLTKDQQISQNEKRKAEHREELETFIKDYLEATKENVELRRQHVELFRSQKVIERARCEREAKIQKQQQILWRRKNMNLTKKMFKR